MATGRGSSDALRAPAGALRASGSGLRAFCVRGSRLRRSLAVLLEELFRPRFEEAFGLLSARGRDDLSGLVDPDGRGRALGSEGGEHLFFGHGDAHLDLLLLD